MKILDYIYAHIYIWYNRMKLNGRRVDPQSLTAFAFVIWGTGVSFVVIKLCHFTIDHRSKYSPGIIMLAIIGFSCGGIINEMYSSDFRYLKVYNKYALNGDPVNRRGILYSWIFILVPLAFYFSLCFW